MNNREMVQLNNAQETILKALLTADIPQVTSAKLLGGTALARCYLQHRVSYDLDFFLPDAFDPRILLAAIQKAGIQFQTKSVFDKETGCVQVHGAAHNITISFIEDKFYNLFPSIKMPLRDATLFPDLLVPTEHIDGIYHRKLVCVAGDNTQGSAITGRQKARDIFDIYALSKEYKSLPDFIPSLPYPFPAEQFIEAFASIRWHEILPEMEEILPLGHYSDVSLKTMEKDILTQLDTLVLAENNEPEEDIDDRGVSPC